MITVADLEEIRKKALDKVVMRKENGATRIVVGLATCGIAAGAKPVLQSFRDEVKRRNLQHVQVAQTGCIGVCRLEPIVEVYRPGEAKVTYCKVTPDMAGRIISEHVVNGSPVNDWVIGKYE